MILDAYGKPIRTDRQRWLPVRASYDAAQTTTENQRHWANADALSADAAANASTRAVLRKRARYEVANNTYAKGIILTLANDTVGTGPRLQLLTDNAKLNRDVEAAFAKWAHRISLAAKLRTMRMAKATDGEVFGLLMTNPGVENQVQLDLRLVEAECVRAPWEHLTYDPRMVDGVVLDEYDNPMQYYVTSEHPGDSHGWRLDYDTYQARSVIHWFRADRPGQHRGVCEITAALPLFAQLRRYTLAVLMAAETAADFAAVLYTDAPADGNATPVDPLDTVELERGMATTMPEGWRLGQIEAVQPTTTYKEFKGEVLNEIARVLSIPYNIAAGNSSGYNYASGRLDHQTYYKAIRVEQIDLGETVLDPLLEQWYYELSLLSDFAALRNTVAPPHLWFWDGTEHVDPLKEANAQAKRLESNTTTLAREYAKAGLDWEEEIEQRGREKKKSEELGLISVAAVPAAAVVPDTGDDDDEK